MRMLLGRPYALLRTALWPFLAVVITTATHATPDSTDHSNASLLFVGHLNFDCIPDSVYGWPDAQHHYLPHSLHWGRTAAPADSHQVAVTAITYPDWQDFTGTVAFRR